MANIIIKSEERKAHEAYILQSFGKTGANATKADREAAACISARTSEAYSNLKKMEGKS